MAAKWISVDRNDACADVAGHLSDVIAIYPITPSSGMAEPAVLDDPEHVQDRRRLTPAVFHVTLSLYRELSTHSDSLSAQDAH
jgi:hypothetical protein